MMTAYEKPLAPTQSGFFLVQWAILHANIIILIEPIYASLGASLGHFDPFVLAKEQIQKSTRPGQNHLFIVANDNQAQQLQNDC